jgi:hypothetical protein
MVVETDKEKGGDAGQLPEDEQGDQVAGQHQAEHGGHEQQQKA